MLLSGLTGNFVVARVEYDNFRREFDQWAIEMGGQMRNGVEAVLQPRNAFDAPTISLMSSIEADDATDKSQVANIDQVLCTYPDAGFAKCFNYFDLSNNSRLPDDQAGFIYPFLKTNMVIFGSIQTADRQELNINVERIMEPGLEQLPVLSLRGLIYSEDYFEPSAVNPERHLLLPGTFVLGTYTAHRVVANLFPNQLSRPFSNVFVPCSWHHESPRRFSFAINTDSEAESCQPICLILQTALFGSSPFYLPFLPFSGSLPSLSLLCFSSPK